MDDAPFGFVIVHQTLEVGYIYRTVIASRYVEVDVVGMIILG